MIQIFEWKDLRNTFGTNVVDPTVISILTVHRIISNLNSVMVGAATHKIRILTCSKLVWSWRLNRNEVGDHLTVHVITFELCLRESSCVKILTLYFDGFGHRTHILSILSSRILHIEICSPIIITAHPDFGGLEAVIQRVHILLNLRLGIKDLLFDHEVLIV